MFVIGVVVNESDVMFSWDPVEENERSGVLCEHVDAVAGDVMKIGVGVEDCGAHDGVE